MLYVSVSVIVIVMLLIKVECVFGMLFVMSIRLISGGSSVMCMSMVGWNVLLCVVVSISIVMLEIRYSSVVRLMVLLFGVLVLNRLVLVSCSVFIESFC